MMRINLIFIIIIFFYSISTSHADKYTLSAAVGPFKKAIFSFEYNIELTETDYLLNFKVLSKGNISKIITSETNGKGYSKGIIKNGNIIIKNYEYLEQKGKVTKRYSINFNDPLNIVGIRVPSYDKSKLTPIKKNMLFDVIDPALAFYKLANFLDLENCNKNLKIYDAKRRFDLLITRISRDQNGFKCLITSKKIGGYKIKDKVNPLEIPYEMIIEFKYISGNLRMTSIEGKNSVLNIILERI